MMKPLDVNHNPCSSCPYRKDVPPAVWDRAEYDKLREYDNEPPDAPLLIFMCHQGPMINKELVCKGWLDVHPDCIAVRIGVLRGEIGVRDIEQRTDVPLYSSGVEAARAGAKGIRRPTRSAKDMIGKLEKMRTRRTAKRPAKERRVAA